MGKYFICNNCGQYSDPDELVDDDDDDVFDQCPRCGSKDMQEDEEE